MWLIKQCMCVDIINAEAPLHPQDNQNLVDTKYDDVAKSTDI
jgi:hypothetical protein